MICEYHSHSASLFKTFLTNPFFFRAYLTGLILSALGFRTSTHLGDTSTTKAICFQGILQDYHCLSHQIWVHQCHRPFSHTWVQLMGSGPINHTWAQHRGSGPVNHPLVHPVGNGTCHSLEPHMGHGPFRQMLDHKYHNFS